MQRPAFASRRQMTRLATLLTTCSVVFALGLKAQDDGETGDSSGLEAQKESLSAPLPVGLWTQAGMSAAYLARDPHVGVDVGI